MYCISRVDCGLLTPVGAARKVQRRKNIGMLGRLKEARREEDGLRVRAHTYVPVAPCTSSVRGPKGVDYNI